MYKIFCPLAAFKISSLSLVFSNFECDVLSYVLLGAHQISCICCVSINSEKVSAIFSSNTFSVPTSFLRLWLHMCEVPQVCFTSDWCLFFLFHPFSSLHLIWIVSNATFSSCLIFSSAGSNLLPIPASIFFFSSDLYFSSSMACGSFYFAYFIISSLYSCSPLYLWAFFNKIYNVLKSLMTNSIIPVIYGSVFVDWFLFFLVISHIYLLFFFACLVIFDWMLSISVKGQAKTETTWVIWTGMN